MARPIEWTEERIAKAKELYLDLLKEGKQERQIDVVAEMPNHNMRASWQEDAEFYEQCTYARAIGSHKTLEESEVKQELVYTMALDDAANPNLVAITKDIMAHARWKASRFNNKLFGDKLALGGATDMPPIQSKTETTMNELDRAIIERALEMMKDAK